MFICFTAQPKTNAPERTFTHFHRVFVLNCLHTICRKLIVTTEQKPEEVAKVEEPIKLPTLRKVAVAPKEEPKKVEVKKTKVKIPKAKKYEELPEIPDYERPELEVYEASDFDPNKASEQASHAVPTPADPKAAVAQQATVGQSIEPKKNGIDKV